MKLKYQTTELLTQALTENSKHSELRMKNLKLK